MNKHFRKIVVLLSVLLILFAVLLLSKWDAVFQRGNPLPYLSAMVKLNADNTFEAVRNMDGIYITKRGNKADLFQMIEDTYSVTFKDQVGSSYLFADGKEHYTIGSEIYWGRFSVWTLPTDLNSIAD